MQSFTSSPEPKHLEPLDLLESTLKAVRDDEQPMHAFLEILLRSKLFVPSMIEPEEKDEGLALSPVIVQSEAGPVVVSYTDASRAPADATSILSGPYAILVEAAWILRIVPPEIGMWINPGWDVGLLMPAQGLEQFKKDYGLTG
jgi:hypothetical protein